MTVDLFAVPVFFVIFRETLETVVIVSVLLAFLKQTLDGPNRDVVLHKRLVKQVGYHQVAISSAKLVLTYLIGMVRHWPWSSDMLDYWWGHYRCLL